MNSKLIGGILLVVGTTIGGAMLALPITSAGEGFITSSILLTLCWLAMTLPALLVLEVNLWLPPQSNLISMARMTLGKYGAWIAWFTYLVLLYSLLSAYIASGTDVLHNLFGMVHLHIPLWLCSCLFVLIFGFIVYKGIQLVDYVNRGLMSAKLISYALLVIVALPFVKLSNLTGGQPRLAYDGIMVMMTSYGFATIVPSLRSYFNDDVTQLRKVILIGSGIPLICYLLWNLSIIGSLPNSGPHSLQAMLHSPTSTSDLVNALQYELHTPWVTGFAHLFVSICVLTAFLAVSLGLTDFLADGLKISKKTRKGLWVYVIAFLPPLFIVLLRPGLFIKGLNYAGICCVILLILLPVLMAWRGRYHSTLAHGYRMIGGKPLLLLLGIVSLIFLGIGIDQLG